MKKANLYDFSDTLGDSNNFVQIESMRMALSVLLNRVRGRMELQEIEFVIDNLWTY